MNKEVKLASQVIFKKEIKMKKNYHAVNFILVVAISLNLFWLFSTIGDAAKIMLIPQTELLKLNQIEMFQLKLPVYESANALFLIFVSVWLFYEINFRKKDD